MNEKKEIYLFSQHIKLSAIKTFESSLYYIRGHTLKFVCTEKKHLSVEGSELPFFITVLVLLESIKLV